MNDRIRWISILASLAVTTQVSALERDELSVSAREPGIVLHVLNRRPADEALYAGRQVVLFVHGSGSPGSSFDVDLPGGSWLDNAARAGLHAYALDIRGYGLSTRPPSMREAPERHPPFAFTADAVEDVAAVVDHLLARHRVEQVALVGWSWGGTIAAQYTSTHDAKVSRLALYAPLYLLDEPRQDSAEHYRLITYEGAARARLRGIPAGREEAVSPSAWFEQVWARNLRSDPYGATLQPPGFRAPNGTVRDAFLYWSQGRSTFQPSRVSVPTLIVLGEWDQATPIATALRLYQDLGTARKRLVVLPELTHSAIHERNRMLLIDEVQRFLAERPR